MPNAYSYMRHSTAIQGEGHSIARQTDLLNAWLEEHPEYVLTEVMIDAGLSGFTSENIAVGLLGAFYDKTKSGEIPQGSALNVP